MKTRFTSLVHVKKNIMQKSERVLQEANTNLQKAKKALEDSLAFLQEISLPSHGKIAEFMAGRALLDAQRAVIQHNQTWLQYAKNEVEQAKEVLKKNMIEYEKYKYLEYEEIQKALKKIKIKEAKDLDEIALMTYTNKSKEAS
ncbi:flagellar export protein FliJ [Sulfurimonas sp. SWIR-19]|uniref:flagellar export protein FliJ n=1 Tax=Sulfurimonas sp. SWIR-19 TaxID=2878390 RepID=UPI001CF1F9DB|nr:flagellar export protein FliJ [Sulfurimonas sp. SWIR-19]UCN00089.1 flagellar export protein FliJ [Sulfurimonas sp. SWIR-19]